MQPNAPEPEPSGRRGLAVIVFTDAFGFTTRSNRNEDRAIANMSRDREIMRTVVERHGGQVLKNTGDGLLIKFDSAVEAVNAAIEIQNTFAANARRLPFDQVLEHRIAIHLGDVLITNNDVYGDGVNTAARLQEQGAPGGIVLSKTVYDVIKNKVKVDIIDIGERRLKGITEPVQMYFIATAGAQQAPKTRGPGGAALPEERSGKEGWLIALALIAVIAGGSLAFYFIRGRGTAPKLQPKEDNFIKRTQDKLNAEKGQKNGAGQSGASTGATSAGKGTGGDPTANATSGGDKSNTTQGGSTTGDPGTQGGTTSGLTDSGLGEFQAAFDAARMQFLATYDFGGLAAWIQRQNWAQGNAHAKELIEKYNDLQKFKDWMTQQIASVPATDPIRVPPDEVWGNPTGGIVVKNARGGMQELRGLGMLQPGMLFRVGRALIERSSRNGSPPPGGLQWVGLFSREFSVN